MGIIWRGGCGLSGRVHGWLSLGLLSQVKSSLEATINVVLQRKYMRIILQFTSITLDFSIQLYMCIQVFLLECMYPCITTAPFPTIPPFNQKRHVQKGYFASVHEHVHVHR